MLQLRQAGEPWRGPFFASPGSVCNMDSAAAMVLIVEDHPSTRRFLADNLAADGYELLEAETAARPAADGVPLPGPRRSSISGCPIASTAWSCCAVREVQRRRAAARPAPAAARPHRARPASSTASAGFDRGADDYVQAIRYQELRARVDALLRRTRAGPGWAGCAWAAGAGPDRRGRSGCAGAARALQQGVRAALRAGGRAERVFTREELLRGVWGFRAMGADPDAGLARVPAAAQAQSRRRRFVVNVWGVGYRLLDGGLE